jgi:16S rRNA (cytosine967-C5)-methyltransferase
MRAGLRSWRAACRGAKSRCRRHRSRGCWIRGPTAARRAALDILRAVGAGTSFPDARDRALGTLAERDRRLAYELSAGVLRWRSDLDGSLDLRHADPRLHDILRLGAYQLRRLERVPAHAAVSTSVELAREAAGEPAARYVNQALRQLARRGTREEGTVGSHPEWLAARWRARFGPEEAARLIAWNDRRPPLVIQSARWDVTTLRAAFESAGYAVRPAPFEAGLVVARTRAAPPSLLPRRFPGYEAGAFIVQDAAQALVCRFAAVPAGARLYDACAAPGGKTVGCAVAGAQVTAGEGRRERIGRLVDTVHRAGVAVRVVAADLVTAPFRPGSWDAILLDAPCSATGTMARHPDARWRITPAAIDRIARRQAALLDAAAPLVVAGGALVYATCSLEPEENERQVEAFLERHPEYRRSAPHPTVPAELRTAAGDFQSLPQRHGIDGAYAARLTRRS